jgi:hypothetical protein
VGPPVVSLPAVKCTESVVAKYILVVLAAGFLLAGAANRLGIGRNPANRTWLLVGTILALVGLFLFVQS